MAKAITGVFILAFLGLGKAYADNIYRYVDSEGRISYSDLPHNDSYVKLVKTWKGWVEPTSYKNFHANRRAYRSIIATIAERHNVSEELVNAIIHAESYFNPTAISSAGAVGLMQLMPGTARRYGVSNRQNPRQNIEGGVAYLSDLLEMFDNNLDLALAAYNAGEHTVKRIGYKIPPYPETQNYVRKVIDLYSKYREKVI